MKSDSELEQQTGLPAQTVREIIKVSMEQTEALLKKAVAQMQKQVREVQEVVGPHGSVSRLQAGGVRVERNGVSVFADGVSKTIIEADGDFLAGSDVTDPATTSFIVFVNEQTYNSEAMGAGDVLLGDNSSGQSNVKFDASEGQLQFRYGQTVQLYMDTDGSLKAGNGAVTIDANGITLLAGPFPATSYLLWKLSDGTLLGNMDGWDYAAGSESGMELVGQAKNSSYTGTVFLVANDHSGNNETSVKVYENGITITMGITTAGAAGTREAALVSLVSATNALNAVLRLVTRSTGTVANGLGSSLEFVVENSNSEDVTAGYVGVDWVDKTDNSEDAELKIGLMKAGVLTNVLTIDPTAGVAVTGKITNVTDPTAAQDAATKAYVDGAVAVPVKYRWDLYAPPASPNANDKEFDGGSGGVPSGLTEVDFSSLLAVSESAIVKRVILTHSGGGGPIDIAGLYWTIPAGDFTLWTHCSVRSFRGSHVDGGLALWQDATSSTGDIRTFGLRTSSANAINVMGWTAYNGTPSSLASESILVTDVFLRIRRTSSTYAFDFCTSPSGGWARVFNTAALGITPTHFGIFIQDSTSSPAYADFDFLRYRDSDIGISSLGSGNLVGIYA